MDKYLATLIADILSLQSIQGENNSIPEIDFEDLEDDFFMKIFDGDIPFSEQVGLDLERFPDASRLSIEQMNALSDALSQLFESYNISLEFPGNIDPTLRYNLSVKSLSKNLGPVSFGTLHMDFCTGSSEDCELGAYCPCKKIEDEPLDLSEFGIDMLEEDENEEDDDEKYEMVDVDAILEAADGRYVKQLIDDIDLLYEDYRLEGRLFSVFEYDPEEVEDDFIGEQQKSIAEWLNIDLSVFPEGSKITPEDAKALSYILFDVWDYEDEVVTALLSMSDSRAMYAQTLSYFQQKARFDGEENFFVDPLTEEELNEIIAEMPDLLDSLGLEDLWNQEDDSSK
jgi:hypothetical protein